jgi:hypothetical protein
MYGEFNERNSTSRVSCETDGVQLLSEGDENTTYFGIKSNIDATEVEPENDLIYAQRSYVNRAVSYSTDETVTGGTCIDGKPIYRKVLTLADSWSITDNTTFTLLELDPYGSDIEKVVNSKFAIKITDGYIIYSDSKRTDTQRNNLILNDYEDGTFYIGIYISNALGTESVTVESLELILEYTKTID